ncbi:MAG: PD-(D/E)XK nuclease family protein [Nitrospirae bacterium]|nr:PD-(D/E)XK nuclease family protein [Nitrospirota bacterium]
MNKNTKLFIAPLGARNKKAEVFKEILSSSPENDFSGVLYITPSAFGQTEARREFFMHLKGVHKKTAYIPFQAVPLKQLCINLYEAHGEKGIVRQDIEPFILCEILGERNFGYALLLSELLYKLRHYLPDKNISEIKNSLTGLIFEERALKRAVSAFDTLEAYEERLQEKRLIETESALKASIALIREHLKPPIAVFDGFFDPSPLETDIIKAVIENAERAVLLIEEGAEFLKFIESSKVNEKWEIKNEKLKEKLTVRENRGYYAYASMEEEVEGIARSVKSLIIEGINPQEIIVTFPALSKYIPMLKRVFKKHEMPLGIYRFNLSGAKTLLALDALLTSIEDNYPREGFLSFLTSSCFPHIPQELKEWAVTYSSQAGIIKGKDAWLSIKTRLAGFKDNDASDKENALISELQKGLSTVIGSIERARNAKDISSFIDELEAILERFGFWESLSEQQLSHMAEAISAVFSRLRQFADVFGLRLKGIEAVPYIRHLLKGLTSGDEDKEGVRVLPYEFAAGLEAKALFFGGMIEGEFPSRPDIDPVLPEKVKKSLGMPHLEYYLDRQKRYFKRLLNVSQMEPYFSYPSGEADKIFLHSPFLEWGGACTPPEISVFTHEDILTARGSIKQKDFIEAMWSGNLPKGKDVKSLLMRLFGEGAFIRVTDIDSYRKCPLRFYIEKVLRLEVEKPPKFEVEAMLWGSLAHKVMEYLYKDGDVELEKIRDRMLQGLEQSLKEFPIGEFWREVAREIFERLIPLIKAGETEIRMLGFSPYAAERPIKIEIDGIRLKGKIDRIDIKKSVRVSECQSVKGHGQEVILLDYKTGSIDKESIQLPLYAAMWQAAKKETVEKVGFYSLKDGSLEWFPKKGSSMQELIDSALQSAREIVQKMREGIFFPEPFKDTECWYCEHSSLCKRSS